MKSPLQLAKQLALVVLLVMPIGVLRAQDVVISDFPLGVGGSVDPKIFEPYQAKLQSIADALRDNPSALAIITGGADGEKFHDSHDAKNPGLALGRAHVLRRWLIDHFTVDSTRLIIQSLDAAVIGGQYRFASIRVVVPPKEKETIVRVEPAPAKIETTTITPIQEPPVEHLGIQLGGGVAVARFGGMPIVSGAITWKQKYYVEAVGGYTFWNGSYDSDSLTFSTRRRMAGCNLIVFPFESTRLGFLLGWIRIEKISREYYKYVRLSEGALFGLRAEPLNWLSVTAAWVLSKERNAFADLADAKTANYMFTVTAHKLFGGAR